MHNSVHADKLLLCGMIGNREKSLWDGGWMRVPSTAPLANIIEMPSYNMKIPVLFSANNLGSQTASN